MSAQFKLANKKFNQNDMRRLMQEQKAKSKPSATVKKIDSPLAKYSDSGELTCILCKSVVRSEAVWKVHINSKVHKENVTKAKELKKQIQLHQTSNGHSSLKRPSSDITTSSVSVSSEKKFKPTTGDINSSKSIPSDFFDTTADSKQKQSKELTHLKQAKIEGGSKNSVNDENMDVDESKDDPLPEGFFDDPIKDAKIRNLEYKDPQDEEWEKFQREIKEEATLSNAIIAVEQDVSTAERQIEEIDEQIQKWSRVLHMEKKKDFMSSKLKERPQKMDTISDDDNNSDSQDEDDKFDEFLDWRAKKFSK